MKLFKYIKEVSSNLSTEARSYFKDLSQFDRTSWLLVVITMVLGFVSFSIELDLMPFFKHRLDLGNKQAGELYGIRGFTSVMVGIPCGLLIDKLGLKISMVLGTVSYALFNVILALSDIDMVDELVVAFGLTSSGILAGNPVQLIMGRIVDDVLRLMGFNLLYWSDNVGDMIAAFVNPLMVSSSGLGQYEMMFLVSALLSFVCAVIITIFQREPPVVTKVEDIANPGEEVLSYASKELPEDDDAVDQPVTSKIKPIVSLLLSRALWRCLALSFVFIPAKMMFRDMTALVPIYMQNIYGLDVNYSFAIGINPTMLVIFLLPYLAYIRNKPNIPMMLFVGTLLVSMCCLPVIFIRGSSDETPVWIMIAILTIAEMIFSPTLNMFSVSLLPKDHEALGMVLTGLPHVLGTMISGTMSGYLLDTFCPDPIALNYDHWAFYSCENIFVVAALRSLITPLMWLLLQSFIMSKEEGMICTARSSQIL
jgi:MFS family permease